MVLYYVFSPAVYVFEGYWFVDINLLPHYLTHLSFKTMGRMTVDGFLKKGIFADRSNFFIIAQNPYKLGFI